MIPFRPRQHGKSKKKHAEHVSTDEVGGTMDPQEWFKEDGKLDPRSPYAASKAAAEHLVRAAGATFGLDYIITRTGNNYGPYQFPEKLLPLAICNALEGQRIPVYGDGMQIRDWVHVSDNVRALMLLLRHGRAGQTYHIGGGVPRTNLEVLAMLLSLVGQPQSLLVRVADRLGHDRRYAVDISKISAEFNWAPRIPFAQGLRETIQWYQENQAWVNAVRSGEYRTYYQRQYSQLQQAKHTGSAGVI